MSFDNRTAIAEAVEALVSDSDALEAFCRDEMRKPLHSRSPEGFKFRVGSKKGIQ